MVSDTHADAPDSDAKRRQPGRCRREPKPLIARLCAATIPVFVLSWVLSSAIHPARAQQQAQAAQGPPVRIAIFVTSRTDLCYDPGDIAAITALTKRERERINRQGGVAGRPLDFRVFDDARDPNKTIANMRTALADPDMVAMIGLASADRAKATFDALGTQIRENAIPLLSNISVNSIFEKFPTVFTTQATQDDERLPVMTQFIRHANISRPAFAGLADAAFSSALGDGLKRMLGSGALVADHRLHTASETLDRGEVAAMIADFKEKKPDLLVLGLGGPRAEALLTELAAAGTTPPLFVAGRIDALPPEIARSYPNAMYQLAWDRLPETENNRVRKLIAHDAPESWTFAGRKVPQAPGWASGQCKPQTKEAVDPLDSDNLRAIGVGSRFADMVALVATAARTAERGAAMASLRRHIAQQLTTTYAAGRGVFKGSFENWSFQPRTRAAVRTPFIVVLPRGLGRTQLAPVQFVRVRDGSLRQINTLYMDIDLIRAHRVDDNEKTFFAEFYLSMRDSSGASIEQIEFTNAYLDPQTNGRRITVEMLHGGGHSAAYPATMKIYKVAGRFAFQPELTSYPFDTQRFSIDLQPKRGDAPFVVQPPPPDVRDHQVGTDGWDPKAQYVGYDEDFVRVIDAYTHEPSVAPFYQASFVWLMKRQTTDYYLRVVVPLAFILIVAYLSIFIPLSHFEAAATIQVTALLAAVALYLSLPKLDTDSATVSDRIFVFNYMVVSLMIVVSILRVNRFVAARRWLRGTLTLVHVGAIPLLFAAMAWYVHGLSLADR